jgi:hypothetical protein
MNIKRNLIVLGWVSMFLFFIFTIFKYPLCIKFLLNSGKFMHRKISFRWTWCGGKAYNRMTRWALRMKWHVILPRLMDMRYMYTYICLEATFDLHRLTNAVTQAVSRWPTCMHVTQLGNQYNWPNLFAFEAYICLRNGLELVLCVLMDDSCCSWFMAD